VRGEEAASPASASSSAAAAIAAAGAPSAAYDSLPALKQAFLVAVSVCRPLLSMTSEEGGAAAAPAAAAAAGGTAALSDGAKLAFYGLFKQATGGDCAAPANADDFSALGGGAGGGSARAPLSARGDPLAAAAVLRAKRDAWIACRGMRKRDAMRAFVEQLDRLLPNWREAAAAAAAARPGVETRGRA